MIGQCFLNKNKSAIVSKTFHFSKQDPGGKNLYLSSSPFFRILCGRVGGGMRGPWQPLPICGGRAATTVRIGSVVADANHALSSQHSPRRFGLLRCA